MGDPHVSNGAGAVWHKITKCQNSIPPILPTLLYNHDCRQSPHDQVFKTCGMILTTRLWARLVDTIVKLIMCDPAWHQNHWIFISRPTDRRRSGGCAAAIYTVGIVKVPRQSSHSQWTLIKPRGYRPMLAEFVSPNIDNNAFIVSWAKTIKTCQFDTYLAQIQ